MRRPHIRDTVTDLGGRVERRGVAVDDSVEPGAAVPPGAGA
ncbi:hypothetical protein [Mycobacterium sp. SA01]